ncbi:MAG: secF [Dehalococcoidia bacterium]|nr:secF [Dehalococcoidia bacterium]
MIDFVRYRKWFYLATVFLILITALALVLPPRLPWGLEFTSGSALDLRFVDKPVGITSQDIQTKLHEIGLEGAIVQAVGEQGYFIRLPRVEDDLEPVLEERFGEVNVTSLEGSGHLAVVVSFTDPVPESAVQEVVSANADLKASKIGEGRFLVSARSATEADVKEAFGPLESRYGQMELLGYEGAEHLAQLLDFGPPVSVAAFTDKLKTVDSGLLVQAVGENAYLVVGTEVPQAARAGLVPTMEEPFGKAKTISYDRPEDMAIVLTFAQRPAIQDLRAELLTQQAFTAFPAPVGEKQVVLVSRDFSADQQDKLFTALKTKFGEVERQPFSFGAGIAIILDFGRTVTESALRQRLTQLNSGAVALDLGENKFFVGGRNISDEQRSSIAAGLEASFGIPEQSSVDFSALLPLDVRFIDPVQLQDVLANLAFVPLTETVGSRAKIQVVSPGSFFLLGTSLPEDQQSVLFSEMESLFGTFDRTSLDAADDMRLALDFGPAANTVDVRSVVSNADSAVLLESIASNSFLVIGANLSPERQAALLEALEQRFGQAERLDFDGATDIAWNLSFLKDPTIGPLRTALSNAGLAGALAARAADGSYYVVANAVTADKQASTLVSIKEALGDFSQTDFNFSQGLAIGLDFGETPTLASLRKAVQEAGYEGVFVEPAGESGYFLGGRGIPEARQDQLLARLQDRFGEAKRTTFSGPQDLAAVVTLTDQERIAQAVRQTVVAHRLGPNSFFLGQAGIPAARRELVLSSLQAGFGAMRQEPFDFNLGMAANVNFAQLVTPEQIKAILEPVGYIDLVVESRGGNSYFVRADRPQAGQRNQIIRTLENAYGPIDRQNVEFSFVDPEIARRSVLNTVFAVALSSVGIVLYIWYAFRRAPKPFRYGLSTLIAVLHDVVIVIGSFALMGKFRQVEIDSLMVIGILAVIGFSVNNTIVVIDRVRENLGRFPNRLFEDTVNISLNETLSRNLNTTITVSLAILAVLFFGGSTIFNFMLVLLVGILAGMYSSLFLATPAGELFFPKKRLAEGPALAQQ